ncbi:hypothetical protein LTR37_010628 [Vermiconidia calcicola]|uniref:Uncharacterized protein n=1 Tax=Vermiconidia calcicola TaxID=1690605 RepID=A0ACC3N5G2_9PEZI|nr:hypothetical protein LTR37_010628 [Vermiconidia calcicola]
MNELCPSCTTAKEDNFEEQLEIDFRMSDVTRVAGATIGDHFYAYGDGAGEGEDVRRGLPHPPTKSVEEYFTKPKELPEQLPESRYTDLQTSCSPSVTGAAGGPIVDHFYGYGDGAGRGEDVIRKGFQEIEAPWADVTLADRTKSNAKIDHEFVKNMPEDPNCGNPVDKAKKKRFWQ